MNIDRNNSSGIARTATPNAGWRDKLRAVLTESETDERSLLRDDDGMISLATVIGVLIIVLMIGFLGNCIRAVQQKIEVQNAADAAAYSSALWLARGMNAVTASNHLMGELTALCVLHEAVGGPELDEGKEQELTTLFTIINEFIASGRNYASTYVFVDAFILGPACDTVSDQQPAYGAAMLYDSRMTLKAITSLGVVLKLIAFAVEKVPIIGAVAIPMHIAGTGLIVVCAKEYLILRYTEKIARFLSTPKQQIEDRIIPLMARYSKSLAGTEAGGLSTSPLPGQVQRTLDALGDRNRVTLATAPHSSRLRLPIVPEPAPGGGSGGDVPSNYSGSNWPAPIQKALDFIEVVSDFKRYVDEFGKWIGISLPGKVGDALDKFSEITQAFPKKDGYDHNPTRKRLKDLQANWTEESTTQWTRATYPYVDAGRAPVVSTLGGVLFVPLSKAPTWYIHWTNRFTLAKTYQFRKGERFGSGRSADPVALYIMQDSEALSRGHEPWTRDSRRAERIFTIVGLARRDVPTLFSPNVFKSPEPKEYVTYAQAMFYNANEQRPGAAGSSGTTQPIVGWNTLNWDDPGRVPEYGAKPATSSGSDWFPWTAFQRGWKDKPAVKLNWQAKLVPITRTRLTDTSIEPQLDAKFRKPVGLALPFTSDLNAH